MPSKQKVFIHGSSSISELSEQEKTSIYCLRICDHSILVGDCEGVDKDIQRNLIGYKNVSVYHVEDSPRNILQTCWVQNRIPNPQGKTGMDFYALKDEAMCRDCDIAVAFWNGSSIGTANNIKRLLRLNKKCVVFLHGTDIVEELDGENRLREFLENVAKRRKSYG